MNANDDYQEGYYEALSELREHYQRIIDKGVAIKLLPGITEAIKWIDAMLHPAPAV